MPKLSVPELLLQSPALPQRVLCGLLLLTVLVLIANVLIEHRRRSRDVKAPPVQKKDRVLEIILVFAGAYVVWTLLGLTTGTSILGHYDAPHFRDRLFGDAWSSEWGERAHELLGEKRFSTLLHRGYSEAEITEQLKGAVADHRRIDEVNRQLRGDLFDRNGLPLIANRVDTASGQIVRFYDDHPALKNLLGKFSVSPERKAGLEWAFREILAPPISDRNALYHTGKTIHLSLDAGAQKIGYEALELNDIRRKGSIIVLDPHTGQIYVMVSSPAEASLPLSDPVVEGISRQLNELEESIWCRRTGASCVIQDPVIAEKRLHRGLQQIRTRYSEDAWHRTVGLRNTLSPCFSIDRSDIDMTTSCLSIVDSLKYGIEKVHLDVLGDAFFAHEWMHFRQSPFSMGSAFKPFVAVVAEDAGIGKSFSCSLAGARAAGVPRRILSFEAERLPGRAFTLEEGIYRSLNTVFAPLALRLQQTLGTDTLVARMEAFGFNRPISWNTSCSGLNDTFPIHTSELFGNRLYPGDPQYYRANIYSLGIGAENMLRATPLHVALMLSYLANEKYVPMPSIELGQPPRALINPDFDPEAIRRVRKYMQKGVTDPRGTSHRLYRDSLRSLFIAAKTGTSTRTLSPFEIHQYRLTEREGIDDLTGYHSWSIALVGPSENDIRLAAVVSINDAMRAGYRNDLEQSEWASRTAVRVMYQVLSYFATNGFFEDRGGAQTIAEQTSQN